MRDIKRIERIMELIKKIWTHYPDLRLTQLIMNCLAMNSDPYHIEDDHLEDCLKQFCKDRGI